MHYLIIGVLVYWFVVRPNVKLIIRLVKAGLAKLDESLTAYEAGLKENETKVSKE